MPSATPSSAVQARNRVSTPRVPSEFLHRSVSWDVAALGACLAAFVVRFAAMWIGKFYVFPPAVLGLPSIFDHWTFGYEMGRVARSIALGHGFGSPFHGWTGPTAWLPPLYPYLLAGIFRVFGVYSLTAGKVVITLNCIAAAFTGWFVFRIAERVAGREVALWSAWLWAVLPWTMIYSFWAWESSCSALLFVWAFWLTLLLPEKQGIRPWLTLGLLWGVMALTNTALLAAMPFSLAWAWWNSSERHRTAYYVAAWVVMFALCTPWIIRDRVVMGRWMFLRDNFWAEFSFGNAERATGVGQTWRHPGSEIVELKRYVALGELPWIESRKQATMAILRSHPAAFVRLTALRIVLFWTNPFDELGEDLAPDTVLYTHTHIIAMSVLAWAGLVLLWFRRRSYAVLLATAMVFYPAVYYITSAFPRYRHPVEPLMIILGVYAIVTARDSKDSAAPA